MSYTMEVVVSKPPDVAAVLATLGPDVRAGESSARDRWPEAVVHLYRARCSTRGIAIERKGTTLMVKMVAFAKRVSLEPDKRSLAIGCCDHATRVWDTARDQLLAGLAQLGVATVGPPCPRSQVASGVARVAAAARWRADAAA